MNDSKHVLILSQTADIHAYAVSHVIERMGSKSHLVNLDHIMLNNDLEISYRADRRVMLRLFGFEGYIHEIRSTWNRRIPRPFSYEIPSSLSKADEAYAKKNFGHYIEGLLSLFDDGYAVNPTPALNASANKARQLWWARACGLHTPETIISNNADEICAFFDRYKIVCVKPYAPHSWRTEMGIAVTNNAIVTRKDIADKRSLEVMPHIYQNFISKKSEYRLTMFGQYSVVTKIRSDELRGEAEIDWRANMDYLSLLEPGMLDQRIIESCRLLMKNLGLRFGTMDLVEDHDGKIYFLEVNQAGQWLWQEDYCPECLLLEPFSLYLLSADDGFTWDPSKARRELGASEVLKLLSDDEEFQAAASSGTSKERKPYQTDERDRAKEGQ